MFNVTGLFDSGTAERPENAILPELTGRAVAGGLIMLVAQRLDQGRAADLPALAPDVKDHENSPLTITEFPHPLRLPPVAF